VGLALTAYYLADESALARFPIPAVSSRLRPLLLEDGFIVTCVMIDVEIRYSSGALADYEAVLDERRSDSAPITPDVMATAIELQHALARSGQHRVPIPDLVSAAAARAAGLVVLHCDADFEGIAAVGGAGHEWVAPQGTGVRRGEYRDGAAENVPDGLV
jgi:predicted nucleic acid-binding protein